MIRRGGRFARTTRLWMVLAIVGFGRWASAGSAGQTPAPVDFERDVRPILAGRCLSCHSAEKPKGGLRLDRKADALAGGGSGRVIEPGKSSESLLIEYVAGLDPTMVMPPKGPRLSPDEVGRLRAWIDQGAVWPDDPPGGPVAVASASTRSDHWAFQPVRRPDAPAVSDPKWVRNPIDAFILARLDREGVRPAAEAERATLIRRLSLDLLGLPPTPEEVAAFVADPRPGAYEELVERLLASPRFGERWGRHWLDLARYADSDGYEKDSPRPNAWRYRDWVIAALNRDEPFDAFTIEQIAGDLVPGADLSTRAATGFHRNTLTNTEGGVDKEEYRVKAVVDRVNTTGTVWLGLTVGCAQCHSHKYDPLSQKEYYGLFAFFNTAREVDVPVGPATPRAPEAKGASASTKKPRPKPVPAILVLEEHPSPPRTHILIRGDFLREGDEVRPGTPRFLPATATGERPPTRLDLARWLVDRENPLTARVAANRVWHHLFGRGLVGTPEDFGTRGEKPSHPELLDWLADEFMALGWSQKRLIQTVVTSAAYRQSSATRPELLARDPRNVWLARQNRLRLEAESLRDAALACGGLLAPVIGGPSVRPPQPSGVAEVTYAGSARWVESTGADRYRRGLYTWFQRTSPYPMLMTFDAPDANVCAVRRERSNTPIQALTLLNDATLVECAQALGARVASEADGTDARIRRLFQICLARGPSEDETRLVSALHADLLVAARAEPSESRRLVGREPPGLDRAEAAAWVAVARTVLNLDEFVTRE